MKKGDIYENNNGWQRRMVLELCDQDGKIMIWYATSYKDKDVWSNFETGGAFNLCSKAHLSSWGDKI